MQTDSEKKRILVKIASERLCEKVRQGGCSTCFELSVKGVHTVRHIFHAQSMKQTPKVGDGVKTTYVPATAEQFYPLVETRPSWRSTDTLSIDAMFALCKVSVTEQQVQYLRFNDGISDGPDQLKGMVASNNTNIPSATKHTPSISTLGVLPMTASVGEPTPYYNVQNAQFTSVNIDSHDTQTILVDSWFPGLTTQLHSHGISLPLQFRLKSTRTQGNIIQRVAERLVTTSGQPLYSSIDTITLHLTTCTTPQHPHEVFGSNENTQIRSLAFGGKKQLYFRFQPVPMLSSNIQVPVLQYSTTSSYANIPLPSSPFTYNSPHHRHYSPNESYDQLSRFTAPPKQLVSSQPPSARAYVMDAQAGLSFDDIDFRNASNHANTNNHTNNTHTTHHHTQSTPHHMLAQSQDLVKHTPKKLTRSPVTPGVGYFHHTTVVTPPILTPNFNVRNTNGKRPPSVLPSTITQLSSPFRSRLPPEIADTPIPNSQHSDPGSISSSINSHSRRKLRYETKDAEQAVTLPTLPTPVLK